MSRIATLLVALMLLAGCHDHWSWSVTVTTYSDPPSTYSGSEVGLTAVIHAHRTDVWIDTEDWDVVTAPGAYVLHDHGQTADFSGTTAGDYVLRYRVTYWADNGYHYAQESFVTVTVLAAPPG
jgi:hypothetical protein